MEKIILKDKREIEVVSVSENEFTIEATAQEMVNLFESLNQKNLAQITLVTEEGETMAIFQNKDKVSCEYADGQATIALRTVDNIEVRLTELECAFDELVMMLSEGGEE